MIHLLTIVVISLFHNIAKFKSLRLTLIKVVLKFIALGINYAKVTNAPLD